MMNDTRSVLERNQHERSHQGAASLSARPTGPWHLWITLTGPGDNVPQRTVQERESLRRARLNSAVILGMLLLAIGILPLGIQDPSHATLSAVVILILAVFIAASFNRLRQPTIAGLVIVTVLFLAIIGAVVGAQQLDFIYLPAFDLLALVIGVAGAVLPRRYLWLSALAAVAFVVLDIQLQARTPQLDAFVRQYGPYTLMARPVFLIATLAILLQLLSYSVEMAIRRADRAEEMAQLEHAFAEQRRQLEVGAQQLLETHVRVANGDYSARAPLSQDNMLWQVAASLNNLITRIQRSGDAEFKLRRTEEEMMRVVSAIDDANGGRRPLWPAPTGTVVDELLRRLTAGQRARQPAAPPPSLRPPTPAPPSSFAQPSYPAGMGQMGPAYPPPGTGQLAPTYPAPAGYPAPADYDPRMPGTGGLGMPGIGGLGMGMGSEEGWPPLNAGAGAGAGGHAPLASDNPWVLPADE